MVFKVLNLSLHVYVAIEKINIRCFLLGLNSRSLGVMELEIMIWAYTRHEAYTVKTGYEMLAKAKTMLAGPIYLEEQKRNALKNKIWKIPTLPKIQMFLWRAVSGALAVVERLKSRGLGVDTHCKLCQGGPENIITSCSNAQ